MTAAFGHRWTSIHGDNFAETSGRIWAMQLAGLGQKSIARGLEAAVKLDWPPVLADFKAMCVGILPLTIVELQRAGKPADQHPFTILVGQLIDYTEWRMATAERQERMLSKAYEQAKAHVLGGGKLPTYTPASMQLTAEDERPPPPPIMLTADQAMNEIRKTLGIRDTPAEPAPPPAPRETEPCRRCNGTMKDPLPDAWHPQQQRKGECLACYGSGVEASYNRIVHEDGTTEERI